MFKNTLSLFNAHSVSSLNAIGLNCFTCWQLTHCILLGIFSYLLLSLWCDGGIKYVKYLQPSFLHRASMHCFVLFCKISLEKKHLYAPLWFVWRSSKVLRTTLDGHCNISYRHASGTSPPIYASSSIHQSKFKIIFHLRYISLEFQFSAIIVVPGMWVHAPLPFHLYHSYMMCCLSKIEQATQQTL